MPAVRKRENRGNQFYNVGEQGRKTGIRLEDKGVRDEFGMEPISGIFSSPEKSPPKRGDFESNGTATGSESMDIQESSIPDLTPGHILQRNRPNLPPPKSRSPMKTSLGSSPRRQSSMGPRAQSANNRASPDRATSQPLVSRMLDFEQDESSLQDTPALSGSGARREKPRGDIYDVEFSPSRGQSAVLEESIVQEEITAITADEDSAMFNEYLDESFAGVLNDDTLPGAETVEKQPEEPEQLEDPEEPDITADVDDSEVVEEIVEEVVKEVAKQPAKRGRKRKSDAIEAADEETPVAPKAKRRGTANEQVASAEKGKKKSKASPPNAKPRRSKRVSEATEQEDSTVYDLPEEEPVAEEEEEEEVSIQEPKPAAPRRGRPPKATALKSADPPSKKSTIKTSEKPVKKASEKQSTERAFKKPKAVSKTKPKAKAASKEAEKASESEDSTPGQLVDVMGKPLSKEDIDQMSTTSAGSRFGRGRSLSVFRTLDPDQAGAKGRFGRRRLQPVNFWMNEHATYDLQGNLQVLQRNETKELPRAKRAPSRRKKRNLADIEEEEEAQLEDWERDEGVYVGVYKDFDTQAEVSLEDQLEEPIAWAQKGIQPVEVPGANFKFTKLASAGDNSFFSWGYIELAKDGHKRSKNSRRMHMVFHVTKGAVEVQVSDNEFIVHSGGLWQVPRGNTYSIRNVANTETRVFFSQAFESINHD